MRRQFWLPGELSQADLDLLDRFNETPQVLCPFCRKIMRVSEELTEGVMFEKFFALVCDGCEVKIMPSTHICMVKRQLGDLVVRLENRRSNLATKGLACT
jgi:hypothetical protein